MSKMTAQVFFLDGHAENAQIVPAEVHASSAERRGERVRPTASRWWETGREQRISPVRPANPHSGD